MAEFLLNGSSASHLSLADRAIHYGDGLFETLAIRHGRFEFWQRHMARLERGCARLGIAMPEHALLLREARALATGTDGVLKIIISRGEGGRGYRPPSNAEAETTRLLALYPLPHYPPEYAEKGVAMRYCATPVSLNPALAGLKHLNRLEQVLARAEWSDAAIAEGVMCNLHDQVVEGTMSNLFFVSGGTLHTPDLSNNGVAGIIREVIMDLAADLNIPLRCGGYPRSEFESADEMFITNSIIGLWPVRQIESRAYGVGPVTVRLLAALAERRERKGEYESI